MSPSSQQQQTQKLLESLRVPRTEAPPANLARLLLSLGLAPDTVEDGGVAASGGSKKPRKGKANAAVSGGKANAAVSGRKGDSKKSHPVRGDRKVSLPASMVRGCTSATCSPPPMVITRPQRIQVLNPVFAYEFSQPPPNKRTPKPCQVKGCGEQIALYNPMKKRWECLNH